MSERVKLRFRAAMGACVLHVPPPQYDPVSNTIYSEPGTSEVRGRHWLEVWEMSDGTLQQERVETPTLWDGPEEPLF